MQGDHLLELKMLTTPIQASQEMRPSVWMLARPKAMMAATATKTAVQAPCDDRAFSAVEIPNIPEPPTKIQSKKLQYLNYPRLGFSRLTQGENDSKEFIPSSTEKLTTDIINAVDIRMVQLEHADNVIGPARHGCND